MIWILARIKRWWNEDDYVYRGELTGNDAIIEKEK